MKKKTLAVLLAVSMTAGLAACGGGDSAPTADTGSGSAADDAADRDAAAAEDAMSDADTSEHVVITYMTTGDAPSGDALNTYNDMMEKLNAILTEKVNAELETYFISWTDYLANYNLTLAQMDGSVDLVGTSSDWLDSWPRTARFWSCPRRCCRPTRRRPGQACRQITGNCASTTVRFI